MIPSKREISVAEIDQCLPQTQCTQCDYPRCADYAEAIVAGEAEINQCPPGAEVTINALSTLTGRPVLPLNPDNGVVEPKLVAFIDEAACIGCRLCIKACPVDSIIGAAKVMHTVIAEECTGCKLCVPVCPTDCIHLELAGMTGNSSAVSQWPEFTVDQVEKARIRTQQRVDRIERREIDKKNNKLNKKREVMKREIAAALARKRGNKSG